MLEISDDSDSEFDTERGLALLETSATGAARTKKKVKKYELELKPCKHVFCVIHMYTILQGRIMLLKFNLSRPVLPN